MRYFFFVTSKEPRGANGALEPTLRALPGQTFDDGSEVDTQMNVQAPKEVASSANGTRLEYPNGTHFCSSHLEKVLSKDGTRVTHYSVYDAANGIIPGGKDPDFHPVSDDPGFSFLTTQHCSDKMNIMFLKFKTFRTQVDDEAKTKVTPKAKKKDKGVTSGPADIKGNAKPAQFEFEPRYPDQLDTESALIVKWMKQVLNDWNLRSPSKQPRAQGETLKKIDELYRAGETVNTICSRERLLALLKVEKMDLNGLMNISKGPMDYYLDLLLKEHVKQSPCSAVERQPQNLDDVADAVYIIAREMDELHGTVTPQNNGLITKMRSALEMGWNIDDMLNPDILNDHADMDMLLGNVVSGVVPLPNKGKGGKSLFDTLATDKKLECPKAEKGFYVDNSTWLLLLRNLKVKQNTLLTGPSGSGKTELVKKLCEVTNTPLTIIQMGGVTDVTEHLVGKMDLDPSTGGTKFDWAEFALAIQRPGVILLDEINRIPRGGANILYSVLDNTRTLMAAGAKSTDTREIKVNPEVCFFATANLGDENTDAHEIDDALRTRLTARKTLDFMEPDIEAKVLVARTGIDRDDALTIAMVAKDIRDNYANGQGTLEHGISMRETIYTAELVRDGLSVEDALEFGVVESYSPGASKNDRNSQRGQVKTLISTHFNPDKK